MGVVRKFPGRSAEGGGQFFQADPPLLDDLAAPAFLSSPRAIAVWDYLAPKMRAARLLTVVDVPNLVLFCEAFAETVSMQATINKLVDAGQAPIVKAKEGGGWTYHPAYAARNSAAERSNKLSESFGMSPLSRTKIRVQATQTDLFENANDSISALVSQIHQAAHSGA